MSFYAVKSGKRPGIYNSWSDCEAQVKGFANATFKKFSSKSLAEDYIKGDLSKTKPLSENSVIKPKKRRLNDTAESNSASLSGPKTISLMHDTACPACVVVYTDGCCKKTKEGGRAGIGVYWGDNHPWNVSSRVRGVQANNRAEIAAACVAISRAQSSGLSRLRVCTDSMFTINCATDWGHKWRRNGWRLADGGPVQVRTIVETLMNLLDSGAVQIDWNHVPGHKGIPGNEAADRLANSGADLPLITNDDC